MELELKNIIDKIKEEGVTAGETRAEEIVAEAELAAKNILKEAEVKKNEILKDAQKEAQGLNSKAEEAVRQSARDVVLGLKEDIIAVFDRVIKKEVAAQLSPDILKEMIVKLAENVVKNESFDVEILLNKEDKQKLEQTFLKDVQEEFKKGVTLTMSGKVEKGFRIGEKDKNSYYDFTDEAIAEAFKAYLNPKMVQILSDEEKKN